MLQPHICWFLLFLGMSHAVVCFLDEGESDNEVVQEVPLSWLRLDNTVCLWPPTNSAYHIMHETLPTVAWKSCRIRCDRICDSLEDARRRCTKETSSEDEKGRGQRRKFLSKHLIGHKSKCPSPPMIPEYIQPHSSSQQSFRDSDYRIEDIGTVPHPENINRPLPQPASEQVPDVNYHLPIYQDFHQDVQPIPVENNEKLLKTIEKKIDRLTDLLGKIRLEIESLKNGPGRGEPVDNQFKDIFPFTTIDLLKEFSNSLSDDKKKILTKHFLSIGGLSAKDFHTRIMTKVFTNSLAMICSWKGFKNNYKVEDMTIMQCMYNAIVQDFPTTLKEFEILTWDWLRHAKQRKEREMK